jgi:hypothetical protein
MAVSYGCDFEDSEIAVDLGGQLSEPSGRIGAGVERTVCEPRRLVPGE